MSNVSEGTRLDDFSPALWLKLIGAVVFAGGIVSIVWAIKAGPVALFIGALLIICGILFAVAGQRPQPKRSGVQDRRGGTLSLLIALPLMGMLNAPNAHASRGGQHRGEWSIGWVHIVTPESAPLFDGDYGAVLAVSRTEPTECLRATGKIYGGWWHPVGITLDEFRLIANACDLLGAECNTTPLPEHKMGFEGYGYVAQDVIVQWFAPNADCAREAVDYLLDQIDN